MGSVVALFSVVLLLGLVAIAAWRYGKATEADSRGRAATEADWRRGHLRFRTLVETAYEGIVVGDAQNHITFANRHLCELMEVDEEEVLGRDLLDYIDEADRERVSAGMARRRRGESDSYQIRLRRPDGGRVWALLSVAPIIDDDGRFEGSVGILADISDRVEAEQELRQRESRFRALVEKSPSLISTLDRDGTMRYQSPSVTRLLGYEPDALAGRSVFDFLHPDDEPEVRARWDALVGEPGATLHVPAFRFRHMDGSWRVWQATVTNRLDDRSLGAVVSNARDITEWWETERRVREQAALLDKARDAMVVRDLEGVITYWNPAAERIYGWTAGEAIERSEEKLLYDDATSFREATAEVLERDHWTGILDHLCKDGRIVTVRGQWTLIRNDAGDPEAIFSVNTDITDEVERQERIRFQGQLLDSVGQAVTASDEAGKVVYWNRAAAEIYGWTAEEAMGREILEVIPTDANRDEAEEIMAATGRGETWTGEGEVRRKDGRVLRVMATLSPIMDPEGQQVGVVGVSSDISEMQRLAADLKASEELFRAIAENVEDVFWITTPGKEVMEYVSPGYRTVMGYPPEELYEDAGRWVDHVHAEDRERVRQALPSQVDGTYEEEYRVVRPDGEIRWFRDRAFPIADDGGKVYRVVGVAQEITRAKEAAEQLRFAERRYRALVEKSGDVVSVVDRNGVHLATSRAMEAIAGVTAEEVVGTSGLGRVHPEDRDRVSRRLAELAERPGAVVTERYRVVRRDGEVRHLESVATNLLHDPAVEGIVLNTRDVTNQTRLEEQLHQSQKMEAVGRLAGGVAHDFNNLLTVVRSQADLVVLDLAPEDPLRGEIEPIRDAADRAAALTRQLLAFSREQVFQPRVVDLNEVLGGMTSLLARTLGEHIHIETHLSEELPAVQVDPVQLEQVLLNLAVNARDAMPEGGRLDVSTSVEEISPTRAEDVAEVEPGTYVRIDVTDTGAGMEPETRQRIFEPFFTTKASTGGTGLGLATSYGIVRQSGGSIQVESEPHQGSTFTIRLPATEAPVDEASPKTARDDLAADLSGRVLIVEDDASVRRVARRILERAGLTVRLAEDIPVATRLLEEEGNALDLVITDLVMPGGSGRRLVDFVRTRFLGLPVIVMSGYAEGSPGSPQDLAADIPFLQKPFSPQGLTEVVRETLKRREHR